MDRRVPQLAQLLVLEQVEEGEPSVRGARCDGRMSAVRHGETSRVRFLTPRGTRRIPSEQGSDSPAQAEQPLDHSRRRLDPGSEYGAQVVDRAAGATATERDCPDVLDRDVLQQCVHAKGTRSIFAWIDTHDLPGAMSI